MEKETETETEINLSVKEEEGLKIEDVSGKVHQLPCSVKYNGPSSVSQYFKPKPTPTTGIQESFFRGRNLLGTTLPIPHPYSGQYSLFSFSFFSQFTDFIHYTHFIIYVSLIPYGNNASVIIIIIIINDSTHSKPLIWAY